MPSSRWHKESTVSKQSQLWWITMPLLAIISMGMGSQTPDPGRILTIEALYTLYNLPGECKAPVTWEGETVKVSGLIDPDNIFDHQHYPRLPYEKFRLVDGQGRSVEIWAQADDNTPIFKKIALRTTDAVIITGRLVAVTLHKSNSCQISAKVVIDHADQVQFR